MKSFYIKTFLIALLYTPFASSMEPGPGQVDKLEATDVSFAVLPFVHSGISDKIAESLLADFNYALIEHLSKVQYFTINADIDLSAIDLSSPGGHPILDELGIDILLEGAVRFSGDTVRVTAQLIDGDSHLWAETYELRVEDLPSMPSRLAKQIEYVLK